MTRVSLKSSSAPDPAPVALDAATLSRRLDRERLARKDAEAIAERTTRDLYERQAELLLVEAVTVASNQAVTVEEAMLVAVQRICEHTGWPLGHVYVREGDRLTPTTIWHPADRSRFEAFVSATMSASFDRGIGLPGRVLASGAPAWIVDAVVDPNFPRASAALAVGLRSALAFPVLVRTEVVGVLEFFTRDAVDPNERLLKLLAHAGTQLGRVVERRESEERLRRLARQNELLLTCAAEGIYGTDADGITTFVNPAAAAMLGWQPEELLGQPVEVMVRPPDSDGADDGIDAAMRRLSIYGADDHTFWRKDGTSFPVSYVSTPIVEDGRLTGAVITFSDTSERKRFESQLQYLADHDPLTGLWNRRRFEEELERHVAVAARYDPGGALMVLDLDSFKHINDTIGHHAGDDLVRAVATVLREQLGDTDILARLGGDEFAVILPRADRGQAARMAACLVEAMRGRAFAAGGHPIRVTTSVGVMMLGDREATASETLIAADTAMYAAKDKGRDGFMFYVSDPNQGQPRSALTWSERIRGALAEDRFELYCQPILDLATGTVSQHELLLRLIGEDGELILPGAFLPAAERFGLIQDIDRWVTQQAIRMIAALEQANHSADILLEINISGKSVGDHELPELIAHEIQNMSIDPSRLVFEITETAVIANMDDARAFAQRLTRLGCRFALDDFGAGFGSFSYLKYLPLDYLKIDGDFIRTLPRSAIDQRMVNAMVGVARSLGMKTIAEFVRDQETVRLLRDYRVDFAQGYHIGRPRPASTLINGDRVSERARSLASETATTSIEHKPPWPLRPLA
jgi:diguanylate cyclase (GGDEF)-like protein/PAS domain S-box-containing protein